MPWIAASTINDAAAALNLTREVLLARLYGFEEMIIEDGIIYLDCPSEREAALRMFYMHQTILDKGEFPEDYYWGGPVM